MTDASLAALAETLSRTSPPLLALESAPMVDAGLRGSVTITDTGRAVLSGRRDRVATCGIDRWLGGVRLQGRAVLWRWDVDRDRIVRSVTGLAAVDSRSPA
jgi:hypothetical protein